MMKGFYSSIVPKHTTATIQEVEEELEKMIIKGLLAKEYELICNSCMKIVDRNFNKNNLTILECDLCGEDMEENHYINIRHVRKSI